MPQAVTHVLIVIVLLSLFRDYCVKNKEKFPLHYALIGGVAALIPDIDVAVYYVLSFFGFTIDQVHRTFSHSFLLVGLFLLAGLIALGFKSRELGRHHLKLSTIFFVIAFGILIHLVLDATLAGSIMPLYPVSNYSMGLNLVTIFPNAWEGSIIPSLDAVLLVFWLIYMEVKHRISDFI